MLGLIAWVSFVSPFPKLLFAMIIFHHTGKGKRNRISETGFLSKIWDFSIDAYRNPVSWFRLS
jgi:hypothetical protein